MKLISKHYVKQGDSLQIVELNDLAAPGIGNLIFATAPIYQYDDTVQDYVHVGTRYIWSVAPDRLSGIELLAVWADLQRMAADI